MLEESFVIELPFSHELEDHLPVEAGPISETRLELELINQIVICSFFLHFLHFVVFLLEFGAVLQE